MQKYVMECLGTFFLTMAISLTGNPIAIGLMFMAMVCVGSHISGAHFNAAISFSEMLDGKLDALDTGLYILSQILGAVLAIWLFHMVTGTIYVPDSTPDVETWVSVGMEALLTMVLCWVYLVVSSHKEFSSSAGVGSFFLGLSLLAIMFIGGLFNPSVAVAAMVCGYFKGAAFMQAPSVFVYVVGPLIGGALAVGGMSYFETE